MSKFRVTPAQLRSAANELESLNSNFNSQVETMKSTNATLGTQWEGDARKKFDEVFQQDMTKFAEFSQGIKTFIEQLRKDADEYDRVENQNVDIASSRKSGI